MLPYQINQSEAGSITSNFQGLGDATILANYNVVQTGKAEIQHHLSIGGGVKMATGQYKADKSTPLNNINFQLGTGSFDYLMNATYRLSTGNITLSTLGAYRYNTPNKGRYRYGDVWIMSGTAIYVIHQKDLSLAPYVQLLNEKHYRDAANHILQNHSGGSILYTGGGLDISTTKLTLGINYQIAAKQNLVQGEMTAKPRLSARLSFTL